MDRERNSNCWYKEVCQMDNPCESCIRFIEMSYLMDHSGLPKSKQVPAILIPDSCDIDSFNQLQDIKEGIEEFVEKGSNLYIGGFTGNGKTSWGIKLLLRYFDCIWAGNGLKTRGIFIHVPTLLLQLKDFNNPLSNEFKKELLEADLVVWDEIGGTGMSNYDFSQLLMYIDSRILNDKANIYTANMMNLQDCEKILGARLASRIWTSSTKILLKGRDKR